MSLLAIRLEGYPEKVQRIADAVDDAFPGMVAWDQSENLPDGATIRIEGIERPAMPVHAPRNAFVVQRPWHRGDPAHDLARLRNALRTLRQGPENQPGDVGLRLLAAKRGMTRPAHPGLKTASASALGGNKRGVVIAISALHTIGAGSERELAVFIADRIGTMLSRLQSVSIVSSARPEGTAGGLNADFEFEGLLQRQGDRIRISVRLVETPSKVVCWSAHYDYDHGDFFQIQHDVAALVAAGLEPELPTIAAERMSRTGKAGDSAYELLLRAISLIYLLDRRSFSEAGLLLDRIIRAEPELSSAYSWLALWHVFLVGQDWARDPKLSIARAGRAAEHAVTLDPNDARGLTISGHVRAFLHHRLDEALPLHERALAINPNLPLAWHLSGVTHAYKGNLVEARQRIEHSRLLAPRDPHCFFADGAAIIVELLSRQHEAAADMGRRVTELQPRFSAAYKPYLAALGHMNKGEDALLIHRRLLILEPNFNVRRFQDRMPYARREHIDHYTSGLTLAGAH